MAEQDANEREKKKRAIFEGMSKRGQARILRLGYENWDPFQEPKDPREQIRGSAALRADELVRDFLEARGCYRDAPGSRRELATLCRGILREEARAKMVYEFCTWLEKQPSDPLRGS